MRITNNMIMKNAGSNINATKVQVDKTNTQMTTQQKISHPSEDPVTAIRSLRLGTSLNKINQYYQKNIPDAESWLDVTETALTNMKSLITDIRTECVKGATETLTQHDRNTILSNLKALQEQIYSEGNADYAGRTVFTGYRTNKNLIFLEDEENTSYNIDQTLSSKELTEFTYYTGNVSVPTTAAEAADTTAIPKVASDTYHRMRLAYDDVTTIHSVSIAYGGNTYDIATDASKTGTNAAGTSYTYYTGSVADGTGQTINTYVFDSEDDWLAWSQTNGRDSKFVDGNDMVIIRGTGDLICGDNLTDTISSNKAQITVNYDKTGFSKGELRPEYYYNCTDNTDAANPITYEKYDSSGNVISYSIDYAVASNQMLGVNLEASNVFDSSILQDCNDMIDAVSNAISAHDKVDRIKEMMTLDQYSDETNQANLQQWLEAAQKEMDYADNHLTDLYNGDIGNMDEYLSSVNLAITQVGCKADQLSVTKTRMSEQQQTVKELQSTNDDLDLSDIIIKYMSAYTAYQSSLQAAGRLGSQTLLNYI